MINVSPLLDTKKRGLLLGEIDVYYSHMAEMAVIKTGGKQYVVSLGKKLKIEKLPQEEGSNVVFEEVLLLGSEKGTEIGTPFIEGATVKGKLTEQGKADKVVVFKFKSKKRERKKRGHRQPYSEVEITSIETK